MRGLPGQLTTSTRPSPRTAGTSALVLAAVAALLPLAGCGRAAEETARELRPPLVEAVPARTGALPLVETVNGTVRADNQVAIRPEIAAPIVEVLIRSGEAVERGQPLVRLEDSELRERLRQAEADVRLAKAAEAEARARVAELEARVRRTRALAAEKLVADQDLEVEEARLAALRAGADEAAARVEQARATAAERRSARTKTVVRSPVAGRVGQRRAEVGLRVDPDTVLVVVGNLDEVVVEVPLTEAMLGRVGVGTPVRIDLRAAAGEPIRAALSRVSPFLAEESFTTVGEIDVDNRDGHLRPGMYVGVDLLYGESERATLVPASAVWENPESGERGVFVVEESTGLAEGASGPAAPDEARTTALRPVEVLAEGSGRVGVAGVREGEWVVIVGQHLLWERARDQAAEAAADADEDAGRRGPVTTDARVRAASWERVEGLQELRREDLLADFLAKQRRLAAALGAEIPESEDVVERVLADGEPAGTGAGGG